MKMGFPLRRGVKASQAFTGMSLLELDGASPPGHPPAPLALTPLARGDFHGSYSQILIVARKKPWVKPTPSKSLRSSNLTTRV
jgi:hypothetical protein